MLCLLLLSVLLICIFIITTTFIFWFYSNCYWVLYIVLPLTYIVSPLRKKGEKELIPSYQQISRSTIFSFPWEHVYIFIIQSHALLSVTAEDFRYLSIRSSITIKELFVMYLLRIKELKWLQETEILSKVLICLWHIQLNYYI